MASYERETRVRAPLEDVWAFHSRIEGLETLTPTWMGLRIESVIGPNGERDPEILEAGSEISMSIRPFDAGPRREWTSVIADRERTEGAAYFRDEMIRGPFDRWSHTHAFYADGDATVLRDRVEYDLPLGRVGDVLEAFSPLAFEAMFRDRHRRTRAALERRSVA